MFNSTDRSAVVKMAKYELVLQGFKPEVAGYQISLSVWNEDRTDSYEVLMSPPHIDWLATQYKQRLTEANELMRAEFGVRD